MDTAGAHKQTLAMNSGMVHRFINMIDLLALEVQVAICELINTVAQQLLEQFTYFSISRISDSIQLEIRETQMVALGNNSVLFFLS